VFGGFFDNGRDVRFFGDLHVFDLDTQTWSEKKPASAAAAPSPRSGFQFVVVDDSAYLFGGYSNEKKAGAGAGAAKPKAAAGKAQSGAAPASAGDDVRRSNVHSDIWCLNLTTFVWYVAPSVSACGAALDVSCAVR
jgi:hypothetical protein